MKTEQMLWSQKEDWSGDINSGALKDAQLVLLFGPPSNLKNETLFKKIRQAYPHAYILSGSTAGEILKTHVYDNSLVATAIQFENTVVKSAHLEIKNRKDSLSIGEKLVRALDQEGLCHIFVLAAPTAAQPKFPKAAVPIPVLAVIIWCNGWTAIPWASLKWAVRGPIGLASRCFPPAHMCSKILAMAPTTTQAFKPFVQRSPLARP